MKQKRFIFVASVLAIVISCLGYMNSKFDPLTRYPYPGEETRELIRKNLNAKEIDYIIDYSINPDIFIDYIEVPEFNIYRATDYKYISEYLWTQNYGYPDPVKVVHIVELTKEVLSKEELGAYLTHYSFETVENWIMNGDPYLPESILSITPSKLTLYLDENTTIDRYTPKNLVSLNETFQSEKDSILIKDNVKNALVSMCTKMDEDLSTNQCGGVIVTDGYISYEEQLKLYEEAKEVYGEDELNWTIYPGHNDAQLGLSIQLTFEDLEESLQYEWLMNNAHEFGFVQLYPQQIEVAPSDVPVTFYLRYVGVTISKYLKENNMSLSNLGG